MRNSRYAIQGVPHLPQQQSALGALSQWGMQKGVDYALDAAFPGAGLAREGAGVLAGSLFNKGGQVYLAPGGSPFGYNPGSFYDAVSQYQQHGNEEDLEGALGGQLNVGRHWGEYADSAPGWNQQYASDYAGWVDNIVNEAQGAENQQLAAAQAWASNNPNRFSSGTTMAALFDAQHRLKQLQAAGAPKEEIEAVKEEVKQAEDVAKEEVDASPAPPSEKKKAKKQVKQAAKRPDPKAQAGIDWNVGLGNVGGWDLSTSGNYTLMDNAKDPYKVNLNAKRAFDTNALFGAAPLGGPRESSKYADYQGGEYQERMPGDPIRTNIERGRKPAADPLQAYLDAGISRDQAEMLHMNKVPPPPARRAGGGPIGGGMTIPQMKEARQMGALSQAEYLKAMEYAGGLKKSAGGAIYRNEGGKVPWWKAAAQHVWKNDGGKKRMKQRSKKKDEGTMDWGAIAGSLASSFFNQGGSVNNKNDGALGMYGPIAGMTPGPLGMADMIKAGKDKDISKVSYKKQGGDVMQQVDIAYHDPNKPKAPLAASSPSSSNS